MRIISSYSERVWDTLGTFKSGTPIRFKSPVHDKHRLDDIFIVNAVCSSYRPEDPKYNGKIAITNIRTGALAYVEQRRHCAFIECYVKLEEVVNEC